MTNQIISGLVELTATLLVSLVTVVLVPTIASWLKSKTQSEQLRSVIDDVTKTVQTSVDMLEQTVVNQLKKDGKWNTTSQAQVLNTAVTEIIQNLTTSTRATLERDSTNIESLITRYVEAYIQSKKSN